MNQNYSDASQMLADLHSPETVRLILPHYVPLTRNQLKGVHWSIEYQEKKRAGLALKLCLQSMPSNQPIGMDTPSKLCRICLSDLESYLATLGEPYKDVSFQPKRKAKQSKGRSLK